MKFKRTIVVALALPLLSSAALAQERAGDAALGALSGAVVLGPIGALAGAVGLQAALLAITCGWLGADPIRLVREWLASLRRRTEVNVLYLPGR